MTKPLLRIALPLAFVASLGLALGARRIGRARAAGSAGAQENGSPQVIRFVKSPAPVPQFSVPDFDGHPINPAQWPGKVTILNFWATWCGPCREEIPELIALEKKYPDSVRIIGLSVDEMPESQVKILTQRMGIDYPVGMASFELQQKFGGVPALPTSFVVNREGGIVQKHVGVYPRDFLDTEIRALLNLSVDARVETFEDLGQIFPANAAHATELPGVDFSKLTPEQKRAALKQMNSSNCTCGCKYTLAQCRINDPNCPVSVKVAKEIVDKIAGEAAPKQAPTGKTQ